MASSITTSSTSNNSKRCRGSHGGGTYNSYYTCSLLFSFLILQWSVFQSPLVNAQSPDTVAEEHHHRYAYDYDGVEAYEHESDHGLDDDMPLYNEAYGRDPIAVDYDGEGGDEEPTPLLRGQQQQQALGGAALRGSMAAYWNTEEERRQLNSQHEKQPREKAAELGDANSTTTETARPTGRPTRTPTTRPTRNPTSRPTTSPTSHPTSKPTNRPTMSPIVTVITASPTEATIVTNKPTRAPTTTSPTQATTPPTTATKDDDEYIPPYSNATMAGKLNATQVAKLLQPLKGIGPFRLRMVWSNESCWQGDCDHELDWCIQCEGYECNEGDILWVEYCRNIDQQLFVWIPVEDEDDATTEVDEEDPNAPFNDDKKKMRQRQLQQEQEQRDLQSNLLNHIADNNKIPVDLDLASPAPTRAFLHPDRYTASPTKTNMPSARPSATPSRSPGPSAAPTNTPTSTPSVAPTTAPSDAPTTTAPSPLPTNVPTTAPEPSSLPTNVPTTSPTTATPSDRPSSVPTTSPQPTKKPTFAPSTGAPTTIRPTQKPTTMPSSVPTVEPTSSTLRPTGPPITIIGDTLGLLMVADLSKNLCLDRIHINKYLLQNCDDSKSQLFYGLPHDLMIMNNLEDDVEDEKVKVEKKSGSGGKETTKSGLDDTGKPASSSTTQDRTSGFEHVGFEIRPRNKYAIDRIDDKCVNMHHHPRNYEEIINTSCDLARYYHTSLWHVVMDTSDNFKRNQHKNINTFLQGFDASPQELTGNSTSLYTLLEPRLDPRCSVDLPCGACQGHCNTDDECVGNLKCFERTWGNDFETPPGCVGMGIARIDYCYAEPGN